MLKAFDPYLFSIQVEMERIWILRKHLFWKSFRRKSLSRHYWGSGNRINRAIRASRNSKRYKQRRIISAIIINGAILTFLWQYFHYSDWLLAWSIMSMGCMWLKMYSTLKSIQTRWRTHEITAWCPKYAESL